MERESQYTISSVKKALKVLKLFDSAHKSMTLTEISERADMRKGTMAVSYTHLGANGRYAFMDALDSLKVVVELLERDE